MKLFEPLYDWALNLSKHPHANPLLGVLSFLESAIAPLPPPDVMLAPMVMARPPRWLKLALLTTLTSVLGGLAGYFIGYFLMDAITPFLERMHYLEKMETVLSWFKEYGFWSVFIAGFSPIPYKLFTIAAGASSMFLLPFVLASLIGRGLRFFLVAFLIAKFGPKMESRIRQYIEILGWAVVILAVIGYLIWRWND